MASDFDRVDSKKAFPPTRRSAVALASSDDPAERARAFDTLVRAYWKPVYAHVRIRWGRSADDARDATQAFFARAFEKRPFATYDPEKARFRSYLKGALDNFVRDEARDRAREKRGGGAMHLSLDFDRLETDLGRLGPRNPNDVESTFDVEWTRSLFAAAVDGLEARCRTEKKEPYFSVFQRYVLEPDGNEARPSYAELAKELSLSVTDVTNYLAWGRRTFRAIVLDRLREITTSEDEFRSEARAVLGVDP